MMVEAPEGLGTVRWDWLENLIQHLHALIFFFFLNNVLLLFFFFFFLDIFQSLISCGCSNKCHLSYLSALPIVLVFFI